MSPSPTYGSAKKDPLLAASDALAAQARLLRKKATEAATVATSKFRAEEHATEAVLDRLRDIGNEAFRTQQQQQRAIADAQVASIAPLIKAARETLSAGDKARSEANALLRKFDGVNFNALREGFSADHGLVRGDSQSEAAIAASPGIRFTTDSTRHRIARLQAAIQVLQQHVDANDGDLRALLGRAETLTEVERSSSRDLVERLRQSVGYGDRAAGVYGMVAGVQRLLSEVGDVLPARAPAIEVC
jgi:hypothetical protein